MDDTSRHYCSETKVPLGLDEGYQIGVGWTADWSEPFWLSEDAIRQLYGVEVKESLIVPGELGLFATRDFEPDEMIVSYDGPLLDPDELYKKTGLYTSPYGIVLFEEKIIVPDTHRQHGLGRYANDAFPFSTAEDNNSEMRHYTVGPPEDPDRVTWPGIFARVAISPGEEITFAYGQGYWTAWKPGPRRWLTQLKAWWNRIFGVF